MTRLRMLKLSGAALAAALLFAAPTFADVMVGGRAMLPNRDIIDNAVNSQDHTTLVAAVRAAGLVETLKGRGPFTVFAPTNAAFAALPAGTVEGLLRPENRGALTKVLTYHVVAERLTAADLRRRVQAGNGTASLRTVAGGTLMVVANGPTNLIVRDEKGGTANINVYDVIQSNGVIHSVDHVLLPN